MTSKKSVVRTSRVEVVRPAQISEPTYEQTAPIISSIATAKSQDNFNNIHKYKSNIKHNRPKSGSYPKLNESKIKYNHKNRPKSQLYDKKKLPQLPNTKFTIKSKPKKGLPNFVYSTSVTKVSTQKTGNPCNDNTSNNGGKKRKNRSNSNDDIFIENLANEIRRDSLKQFDDIKSETCKNSTNISTPKTNTKRQQKKKTKSKNGIKITGNDNPTKLNTITNGYDPNTLNIRPSVDTVFSSNTVVISKNVNNDVSHGKIIEYESSTSDYFEDGNALLTKNRQPSLVPSDVDEI